VEFDHLGPAAVTAPLPPLRVGHSFDVHRLSADPGRRLVLGGVHFPGERGLDGHSDADVVAHACIDALLGAAGLGDIGRQFPDDDPTYAGADSIDLLGRAADMVREAGWAPVNVDCTVLCDRPRLSPALERINARLGDALGAPVTVKGRSSEGLGVIGRGEAIAAWAVALVVGS
jgi:2-C-methyl-D-erythritol 2,4-cyclodiphosphate synthase